MRLRGYGRALWLGLTHTNDPWDRELDLQSPALRLMIARAIRAERQERGSMICWSYSRDRVVERRELLCESEFQKGDRLHRARIDRESEALRDTVKQLHDDIYHWLRFPLFTEDFNDPAFIRDGVERIPACHIPATTRDELLAQHVEAAQLFHRVETALDALSVLERPVRQGETAPKGLHSELGILAQERA